MKKILFASTALVATAGVASAQDLGVALTGGAEMGIFGGDFYGNNNDDAQFLTDLEVRFTLSGEADNGLTFGATIDLDEANANGVHENEALQGGEAVFVSFGGATFSMGDVDGAYDARLAEMALAGGSLQDDETTHAGFDDQDGFFSNTFVSGLDGNEDGQIARFDYTFDAFTGSFSIEQDNQGQGDDNVYGVGFSYDGELAGINLGVGIGYQTQNDVANSTGISVTGAFSNGLSAGVLFTQTDFDPSGLENQRHFGIGVGYEVNALSMGLNYGKFNDYQGIDGREASGYGLAVSYDLGGGLAAQLGYSHSNIDGGGLGDVDFDSYSLGLSMSF